MLIYYFVVHCYDIKAKEFNYFYFKHSWGQKKIISQQSVVCKFSVVLQISMAESINEGKSSVSAVSIDL